MKWFGFKHMLRIFLAGCAFCRMRVWVTPWAAQEPGTEWDWCSKQEHHTCHGKGVTSKWATRANSFHVGFKAGGQCSQALGGFNTMLWILHEGCVLLTAAATGTFCTRFLLNIFELCQNLRNCWFSKHLNDESEAVLRQARGGTCTNHGVFGRVKGKCQRTTQLISVEIHKQLLWEVLRLLALM